MDTLQTIVGEVKRTVHQVANVLKLLEDGSTVPFIARYRKEMTGSMDEDVIRAIRDRAAYLAELSERKAAVLKSIGEQDKLTPELKARIEAATTLQSVEDLYQPYRPKRRTRAMMAREKGLEPLAVKLRLQADGPRSLEDVARPFVNADKGVDSIETALAGAADILAEDTSDQPEARSWLRDMMAQQARYTASVTKEWIGKKSKFELYYQYERPVREIPSHALLALRRGEKEGVLAVKLEVEPERALTFLERRLVRRPGSIYQPLMQEVAKDAWSRLLKPSLSNEVDTLRKDAADRDAIHTFAVNLKSLLLSAPAGQRVVMGIDPGFRTGCKLAVVDGSGKYLESATIYPTEPQRDVEGAGRKLLENIRKYKVQLIAIGNGTGGRETDAFVAQALQALPADLRPGKLLVSEAGASVYSASPLAKQEFPDLDVTIRGAISIARRLQDPLAELVKIEPKSIGVGQYQHDVEQKALGRALDEIVESCVNHVGVELNTASAPLLQYVSGVNATLAKNIVAYRDKKGVFKRRSDLLDVPRLGPKAFQQAAGFLRIKGGENPLDASAVHPERYSIVERMAGDLGISVEQLVTQGTTLSKRIDLPRYVTGDVGIETLNDIKEELEKPGRDPRQEFRYASFRQDISKLEDLSPGMVLEGVVSNVAVFGAFVDIGVHQDGLVHKSEMVWRFLQDPNEVVRVGDIVKVKVLSIDRDLKRISLSIRQTQPPPTVGQSPGGK